MIARPKEAITADLTHVMWVLEEIPRWDGSVVSGVARSWVATRYRQQERILRDALVERVEPAPKAVNTGWVAPPPPPPRVAPPPPGAKKPAPVPESNPFIPRPEHGAQPAGLPPPDVAPVCVAIPEVEEKPSVDDALVEQASMWHRIWKPFLSESVGWFIGAFLILVGTLYWVADAWATMSGAARSFTVFGFAAAWTLGFSAWGRFLSRKDNTAAAGRVLALIAAAVAPLATIALGPIAGSWLFFPPLVAWSAFVFFQARKVALDRDPEGATWHGLGAALTTAVMGAAPLLPSIWLVALPLATFVASSRKGPRSTNVFALLAPLYLLGLFAVRMHVAGAVASPGTWAPFAAAAIYGALLLVRSAKPGVLTVGAIVAQVALLGASITGAAPSFFLCSAALFATAYRLGWTYPAYAGAYFAFQTCGQLIPSQLKVLLGHLREALGYAASQPLPAAYDAVYAAVFVVAGGVLAVRRRSRELVTATGWASAFVGVLGLESIAHDPRPTLWSAPFVAALCFWLGATQSRRLLSWIGAALAVLTGAALLSSLGAGLGSAALGALALAIAAASIFALDGHRQAQSAASAALAMLSIGAAFFHPAAAAGLVGVALSSAAALLVARNLGSAELLTLAWFAPACLAPKLALVVGPAHLAPMLAVSALAFALVSRKWESAALASWATALAAPLYAVAVHSPDPGGLGATLIIAGLAFLLGRRAVLADATGIVFLTLALLPFGGALQPLPFMTPKLASTVAFAAVLGASVYSGVNGRAWRPALVATLGVGLAATGATSDWGLTAAALTALVSMRALLPALSVPVATAFAAAALVPSPFGLAALGAGLAGLSLLEEWDFSWKHVLGGRGIAWAASLSALALAPLTLGATAWAKPGLLVGVTVVVALGALAWIRATRWPFFALTIPGFLLMPQLTGAGPLHAWLAVLSVVALTRALQLVPQLRAALFGDKHAERRSEWMQNTLCAGLAICGLASAAMGLDPLPFAAGLLLAAGEPAAWRVAVAAFFCLVAPGFAPIAAVGFIALGLAARHSPRAARWVLGDEQRSWTVTSAGIASVVCASYFALLNPSSVQACALLGGCLAACAVLLGLRWMLSFAVLFVALPVSVAMRPVLSFEQSFHAVLAVLGAAALAAVSRLPSVSRATLRRLAHLGRAFDGPVATPLWLGAAVTLAFVAVWGTAPAALLAVAAALLLVTGVAWEAAAAAALLAAVVALNAPHAAVSSLLAGLGFLLCVAGAALEKRHAVGRIWHHAGWMLSLAALPFCPGLDGTGTLVTFAFGAGAIWCVAIRKRHHEWLAWLGTGVAAHAALFFAGLNLGHGQPHELILPWCGLASVLLGAVALGVRSTAQRYAAGLTAVVVGLAEALGGAAVLHAGYAREAFVVAAAVAVAVAALGRYVLKRDDLIAAWVTQVALALGFVAVRWLGFHAQLDATTAFATLVFGAVLGGAARLLPQRSASAARTGAWLWPVMGLAAVPFMNGWAATGLLFAQAVHFAVLARGHRRFAIMSSVALNAALLSSWSMAGWHHFQYLLVPVGLTALVLLKLYERDFEALTLQRVRAWVVTLIYAAAAFEPLAFSTPWALWLCALVCVVGAAAGIMLRVRSYVFLGTGFLVTTVVASLTRYGIQEPRIGALLLSGLGLLIVGFMVLITTRRSELLQQYQRARSMLAQWQG